jgi:23S rRNA pseudouridine1911/1915/1917 synthase
VVSTLSGLSRSDATELVTGGSVRVDGSVETARSRRLRSGQSLLIDLSGWPEPDIAAEPAPADEVPYQVLYEDEDVIVVDKPAGVVTHPGAGRRTGTLVNGLLARYPELSDLPGEGSGSPERPGIVHRLDKETSGALVIARSRAAFESLSNQLATRSLKRQYRAVVSGRVPADRGLVDAPIGRSERDPTAMAVAPSGRSARTHYEVVHRFTTPVEATELRVMLETGRTHQIRVHLASIGHPVLGDGRYGGRRRSSGVLRLMLHAELVSFRHPASGEIVTVSADLPEDFRQSLSCFG